MMEKGYVISVWAFLIFGTLFGDLSAQELRIKAFSESQEIFLAREQRRDLDGVTCALVRVVVPVDSHARFTGNVIGEVEYEGNEYRVYLSEGSRYLRVHYPGCAALLVDFQSLGYDGVESKKMYELVLGLPDGMRRTMSRSEYERLIARAALQQKEENFAEAVSLYEERKRELIAKGEQGYANEVQERINYCKRRIALQKLKADDWKEALSEGLCLFKVDDKLGFVDSVGNLVVPPMYDKAYEPRDGVVWVMKDSLWGSINLIGEMIVPYQYKHIWNFQPEAYAQNRCLGVSKDMKCRGVIDYKTGEEILPCKYHQPYHFEVDDGEYFCYVDDKDRPVFINKKTGKEQFKLKKGIKFSYYFGDGYSLVYIGKPYREKYGLVDKQGNEVFPCEYYQFRKSDKAPWFITVLPKKKYWDPYMPDMRLYNLKQRVYVGGVYSDIRVAQATESLVEVYNSLGYEEQYGVLNYLTGEEVIHPTHRIRNIELPDSDENPIIAQCYQTELRYLYDMEGNRYEAPKSEEKLNYQCGYTRIKRNGKYGYANAKGELILDCIYDVGNPFKRHNDILAAAVCIGEDSFYVTPDGKRIESEVIEAMYE